MEKIIIINDKTGEITETTVTYNKQQLDAMQYQELSITDWYFVRKVELGIDVPTEIINERLAIREKYDLLKLEL